MAKENNQMKLLAFNITKFGGERKPNFDGELEIKSNINIKDLEKFKPEGSKQESIKAEFQFSIIYTDLGKVEIEGVVFIGADSKTIKETIKEFKDKNLTTPMQVAIMNVIMQKSSIKALEIEEDLGLPPHIRLPVLQPQQKPAD
tara:strand:- start:69 stop:500 length:432 start_codon:yes stop_codon:yes gene_type:complete